MKVLEAVRLVRSDHLTLATLWAITTDPERIVIALLLGWPDQLPQKARTPVLAWNSLNKQQRQLLLDHAPQGVLALLPPDVETN